MTRSQSDDPPMNPDERCTTPDAPAGHGPDSEPTTPTDLHQLAADLASDLWARLTDGGFKGRLDVYPAPQFTDALTVEITPAAFPAPGVEAGSTLVPAAVVTDSAAYPSVVDYLTERWLS